MLEQSVERSLTEMADGQQPHPQVSIQRAIEQGRTRLRRRRLVRAVGAPALAAAVALAVALPAGLMSGRAGHGGAPQTGSYGKLVDGAFDPSYLAIAFGWLPKGLHVIDASTYPGLESLSTQGRPGGGWLLSVYAPNTCRLTTDGRSLDCYPPGPRTPVTGHGPDINGRKSVWLQGDTDLAWQYAPNAWAELANPTNLSGRAVALRIAKAVKYGQHVPVRFASRFTSIPPGWRIIGLHAQLRDGVLLAQEYQLARLRRIGPKLLVTNSVPDEPMISTFPHGAGHTCNIPEGSARRNVTIHGYLFALAFWGGSSIAGEQLCSAQADGLYASVIVLGTHLTFPAATVMDGLQLLGPSPADWVTNPVP
jgi:hypothetical protein